MMTIGDAILEISRISITVILSCVEVMEGFFPDIPDAPHKTSISLPTSTATSTSSSSSSSSKSHTAHLGGQTSTPQTPTLTSGAPNMPRPLSSSTPTPAQMAPLIFPPTGAPIDMSMTSLAMGIQPSVLKKAAMTTELDTVTVTTKVKEVLKYHRSVSSKQI